MRTYKFNTLRGLYRAASGQLTAEALAAGRGDFSLFQCFYLVDYGNGLHFSNSLSGSAFSSVIREYLRRWC